MLHSLLLNPRSKTGELTLAYKEYGSKNNLKPYVYSVQKKEKYTSGRIQTILVIRDADENWQAACMGCC